MSLYHAADILGFFFSWKGSAVEAKKEYVALLNMSTLEVMIFVVCLNHFISPDLVNYCCCQK